MWQSNRPSFEIKSSQTLRIVSKVNSNIIHLNSLIDKHMSASKFFDTLKHFQNKQTAPPLLALDVFDHSNLATLSTELHCCEERLENVSKESTKNDSTLTLNKLFIDAQLWPLTHYVSTLAELKMIASDTARHDSISNVNFCHLMTKKLKLGRFYSIFKKMSTKCFGFLDLFYEGLKAVHSEQHDHDDESSESDTIYTHFRRFANETTSLTTTTAVSNVAALSSFAHSNWLDEFLSMMYMNKMSKQSNKNASNYICSIELILNLFDRKLLKFNETSAFLWAHYSFLTSECTHESIASLDEHLVSYLKSCVDELKRSHFSNEDQAFFGYLRGKGFSKDILKLSTSRASVHVEMIMLGCVLAHMFSPMEPMDPLEYANLLEKNRLDSLELENNEVDLEKLNNAKLKSHLIQTELLDQCCIHLQQ